MPSKLLKHKKGEGSVQWTGTVTSKFAKVQMADAWPSCKWHQSAFGRISDTKFTEKEFAKAGDTLHELSAQFGATCRLHREAST